MATRGEKNNSKDELEVPSLFGSGFKTMCHDYFYDISETTGDLNTVCLMALRIFVNLGV